MGRLEWLAAGGLLLAGAATVIAPMPLLLLCPLLFGVPHVLGDLWVLFFRPGAPRGLFLAILAPLLGMTGLRAASAAGATSQPFWEMVCGMGVLLAAALWARAPLRLGAALLIAIPALLWPSKAALYLGHAHNAIAVFFLLLLAPRRVSIPVALAFLLGIGVILAGALDNVSLLPVAGLSIESLGRSLAPGLEPAWANRLVLSFGFAQAVHYVCWILLLPRSQGKAPDWRWMTVGLLGTLGLCAAALGNPVGVRAGYLSLVLFHGWMELGVLAAGAIVRERIF